MIIDCHCHAGKGDGFTGPWDTDASLHKYLQRASVAGITKTILFPAFHSDYAKANYELSKIINSNRNRFYGFAFVHAFRDMGKIHQMVKTAVEEYGFCGIKLHRHDAKITREVCEAAKLFKLPVLYDVMDEAETVHLFAREYPEVNFIIPHLSSFADSWKAQQIFIDLLVRYKNVHTDTSGVRRFDLLEEALKQVGPEKIIFGTDGPWLHPGVELSKIYALSLSDVDREKILHKNIRQLIQHNAV